MKDGTLCFILYYYIYEVQNGITFVFLPKNCDIRPNFWQLR